MYVLSNFMPRGEYYVLLNDESSTMLKSSIRICIF